MVGNFDEIYLNNDAKYTIVSGIFNFIGELIGFLWLYSVDSDCSKYCKMCPLGANSRE